MCSTDADQVCIPRLAAERWKDHLNPNQTKLVLWFLIQGYVGERGLPAREGYRIAEAINVSRNSASHILSLVLEKGVIVMRQEGDAVSFVLDLAWEPPQ